MTHLPRFAEIAQTCFSVNYRSLTEQHRKCRESTETNPGGTDRKTCSWNQWQMRFEIKTLISAAYQQRLFQLTILYQRHLVFFRPFVAERDRTLMPRSPVLIHTWAYLEYLLEGIFDFTLHLLQQVQFLCAPPLSWQTCQGAVLWLLWLPVPGPATVFEIRNVTTARGYPGGATERESSIGNFGCNCSELWTPELGRAQGSKPNTPKPTDPQNTKPN